MPTTIKHPTPLLSPNALHFLDGDKHLSSSQKMTAAERPRPIGTGSHHAISSSELMNLRFVANGTAAPSVIIRHGSVLSSFTGEFLPRDVVISGRHIAAVTPWDHFPAPAGVEEIEARGKYVTPGFIDAHVHIEYTKLVPGELARLSVPRGTTTVLADANCIANVR